MHNVEWLQMLAYSNERVQFNTAIAQFGRLKLADMATSCYAGKSATYRASKILKTLLVSWGLNSSRSRIKRCWRVRYWVPILKVVLRMFKTVLMKDSDLWWMGFWRHTNGKCVERCSYACTKVQTKSTERFSGMLIKKSKWKDTLIY
jgi:hypothetical protein